MGIKVNQYDVFKINLSWLEESNYDLILNRKQALKLKALVSLFDSQMFQHIRDILTDRNIKLPKTDYSQYVLSLVNDTKSKTRFKQVAKKGFKVNGITFKRFVGTTGGLKANTVLFVNADILDELNAKCECGRNKALKVVPAKYEAYKALTCSASQKICNPKGILVVKDNLINIKADVIYVKENEDDKDSEPIVDERTIDIENNNSDGFNLCTYDYMKRVSESLGIDYVTTGVCLRNAYCKGMMYAFPIVEFCEKYLHDYYVTDIWGHKVDIRTIDLILTESSLKFWDSYSSSEDYIKQYTSHGYSFRVTKVIGKKLEDTRELNYQYLQDYNLTDEDIIELCEPTLKAIKSNTCGDYDSVLKYLGISKTKTPKMAWQQALLYDKSLMYDNFIVSKIKRMIRKKMDEAKIGKLICNGNFQQLSGDAFGLMQSICGLPVTGLLKANECYSSYWQNEELVVFRSPMIGHNNICKLHNTINADTQYWYKYMGNVFILNGFDTTCTALSGADMDGDAVFSTNNAVLLRRYRNLKPIACEQHKAQKKKVTESTIIKSNLNGFGNKVGSITNRATSMLSVQAQFPKDSKEYQTLAYRIVCTQFQQQNEIDKIKGIISKPMPKYWYSYKDCQNDFQRSICCEKKPYFMIYRYKNEKKVYKKFIDDYSQYCQINFNTDIEELIHMPQEQMTDAQKEFVYWFNKLLPVDNNPCTINRICWYIEKQLEDYKVDLKTRQYNWKQKLISNVRCTTIQFDSMVNIVSDFANQISYDNDGEINADTYNTLIDDYVRLAVQYCDNYKQRINICLRIAYDKDIKKQCAVYKDLIWAIIVDAYKNER